MCKRYGENAQSESASRADELAAEGDREGAAVWRLITEKISKGPAACAREDPRRSAEFPATTTSNGLSVHGLNAVFNPAARARALPCPLFSKKLIIKNNRRTTTVGYRYPFQVGWHPSTGDRRRHQCHLGADARRPASRGARLGGGAPPRADLHDVRQLGGILYGIGALPEGRRRSALAAAAEAMVRGGFRRAHPAVRGRRRGTLSQKSD